VSETKVCEECNRHTDRQISQKQSISNGEIYFWYAATDNLGLKSIHFDKDIRNFYIFISIDLELWPLNLKFAPLITVVQRYGSTKLEVSMSFVFRENWETWTDRQTHNVATRESHIIRNR